MNDNITKKPIPNFDGYYATKDGNIVCDNRVLSESYTRGYKKVKILRQTRTVHRLVAMAFIPNPNNYPVVNHLNGIRGDNRPENLEWCTQRDNLLHSLNVLKKKPNRNVCILDTNTGVYYDSIRELCSLYNIKETTMVMRLRGNNKNNTPFIYA